MLNRQKAANDSTSRLLTLTYVRAGVADTVKLTTDSLYQIGVAASLQTNKLLPVVKKEYSFFASIPAGVTLGVNTLKGYVSQMKYLFSKEGAKQLGGFGTIGSIFPATWVSVLVHDGIPFNHSCFHEHSAYSGIGRRTCPVPHLRDCSTSQTQR